MNTWKKLMCALSLGVALGTLACGDSSEETTDSGTLDVVADAGNGTENDAATDPITPDAGEDPVESDAGEDPVLVGTECDMDTASGFCDDEDNVIYCHFENDETNRTIWGKKVCGEKASCGVLQGFYGEGWDKADCFDDEESQCETDGEVLLAVCDDSTFGMGFVDLTECRQTTIGLRRISYQKPCMSQDEQNYYKCNEDKTGCDMETPAF